jgi:hypothetical protein
MKLLFITISVCIQFAVTVGLIAQETQLTRSHDFFMKPEEVLQLTSEVDSNSQYAGSAAFKLYQYYSIYKNDRVKARFWLERAAHLQVPQAEYNLSCGLLDEQNITASQYWLDCVKANPVAQLVTKEDILAQQKAINFAIYARTHPYPHLTPSPSPSRQPNK